MGWVRRWRSVLGVLVIRGPSGEREAARRLLDNRPTFLEPKSAIMLIFVGNLASFPLGEHAVDDVAIRLLLFHFRSQETELVGTLLSLLEHALVIEFSTHKEFEAELLATRIQLLP